jgi:hypothetical protein
MLRPFFPIDEKIVNADVVNNPFTHRRSFLPSGKALATVADALAAHTRHGTAPIANSLFFLNPTKWSRGGSNP